MGHSHVDVEQKLSFSSSVSPQSEALGVCVFIAYRKYMYPAFITFLIQGLPSSLCVLFLGYLLHVSLDVLNYVVRPP